MNAHGNFDMTSYFQDGGHDDDAAAFSVCPLARRARVTSLARRMRYSS